jgi:hypothetical protein
MSLGKTAKHAAASCNDMSLTKAIHVGQLTPTLPHTLLCMQTYTHQAGSCVLCGRHKTHHPQACCCYNKVHKACGHTTAQQQQTMVTPGAFTNVLQFP